MIRSPFSCAENSSIRAFVDRRTLYQLKLISNLSYGRQHKPDGRRYQKGENGKRSGKGRHRASWQWRAFWSKPHRYHFPPVESANTQGVSVQYIRYGTTL